MGPDDGLVLVEHLDAPLGKRPLPARLSPEPDLGGRSHMMSAQMCLYLVLKMCTPKMTRLGPGQSVTVAGMSLSQSYLSIKYAFWNLPKVSL